MNLSPWLSRYPHRLNQREEPTPRDAGLAAVEFALIVPVIVALLFGVITAGTAAVGQLQLHVAARDGARIGSVQSGAGCATALNNLNATDGTGGATIGSVNCANTAICPGATSEINLTATRSVTIPVIGQRTITLNADATFECQPSTQQP